MQSMTGFGCGDAIQDGRQLTIELRSVNHRYLDISMRLPRSLNFLEENLRRLLKQGVERGHVDVYVNYTNTRADAQQIIVDQALLAAYQQAAEDIAQQTNLLDDRSVCRSMEWTGVLRIEETADDRDEILILATQAMQRAIDDLKNMRKQEGDILYQDIQLKIHSLQEIVSNIAKRAPLVVEEYQAKLQERIENLLSETAVIDQSRLANEVAVLADRACVDEEIVRLESHCSQVLDLMSHEQVSIGRKLDFIVQEINRELNTVGSKASDLAIVNCVIDGKAQTEKMREQIQNIE